LYKGCGAAYGFCASKKNRYYGYKLHIIVDENGFPITFDLTGANVADGSMTEELNKQAGFKWLLGDKGYIGVKLSFAKIFVPDKSNAKNPQPIGLNKFILNKRRRIETTISQLTDTLHIETVRARSFWGLCTNIRLKILAFLTAVYINYLLHADNIFAITSLVFN